MDPQKLTSVIVGAALGVIAALCAAKGIVVPGDVQPLLVAAITAVAGFVAPAVIDFGAKYAGAIHAVLTTAASAVAFAVANQKMDANVEAIIVGIIAFLSAIFIPSTAHPSKAGHESPNVTPPAA
jgi:hypothetical protein